MRSWFVMVFLLVAGNSQAQISANYGGSGGGSVVFGNDMNTCNAGRNGAVRYNGSQFQLCYGSGGWAGVADTSTSVPAGGDRITSGTAGVFVSNTGVINLRTGGVTTGYFDASGFLIVPGISLTTVHGVSSTNLTNSGATTLSGIVTPASLSADTNNWSPSGFARASVVRVAADSPVSLTGLSAGASGRLVTLMNVGASDITLKNQSLNSSAANRFGLGFDVTLVPDQTAGLIYDGTSQRWRAAGIPFDRCSGGSSCTFGEGWTPYETDRGWAVVAASSDGSRLFAGESGGQIYTSGDGGGTWTAQNVFGGWYGLAVSSDGTKAIAGSVLDPLGNWGDYVRVSADGGVNWTSRAHKALWTGVASSSDGSKLVALEAGTVSATAPGGIVLGGHIYTSSDSGVTWTARAPLAFWYSVASSTDGLKLVAVANGDQIYTSADGGANWTARESARNWVSVASSADGLKLVAVESGGQIYTSSDGGVNWTARESARNWGSVASSADGTKLVAVENGGRIYVSQNGGASWTARDADRNWSWAAVASATGAKLIAVENGGRIYISSCP